MFEESSKFTNVRQTSTFLATQNTNSPRNHCLSPIKTAPIVLQTIPTAATDSNSADSLESLDSTILLHLRKSATMLHEAHAVLQNSTKTCIFEMQGKYPRQSLRTSAFLRERCCGSIEVSAASRFRPFKIHTTRPLSPLVRYSAKILFLRSFLQREIDETVNLPGENVPQQPEATRVNARGRKPVGGKPEGQRKIEQPTSRLQGHCARTIPTLPMRCLAPTARPRSAMHALIGRAASRLSRCTRAFQLVGVASSPPLVAERRTMVRVERQRSFVPPS